MAAGLPPRFNSPFMKHDLSHNSTKQATRQVIGPSTTLIYMSFMHEKVAQKLKQSRFSKYSVKDVEQPYTSKPLTEGFRRKAAQYSHFFTSLCFPHYHHSTWICHQYSLFHQIKNDESTREHLCGGLCGKCWWQLLAEGQLLCSYWRSLARSLQVFVYV